MLSNEVYNVKTASEYLHMSTRTLHRRINAGKISYHRPANAYLFYKCDLDNYLKGTEVLCESPGYSYKPKKSLNYNNKIIKKKTKKHKPSPLTCDYDGKRKLV